MNDLRFAFRQLLKNPGFTVVAVLTLALGIGANTAMFGFLDLLLLRPPSGVHEPDRLARIYPKGWWTTENRTFPDLLDLRTSTNTLAGAAAYQDDVEGLLGEGRDAMPVRLARASAAFFPLLGVRPALGRFFATEEDGAPDAQPVAVLAHEFWQRQFNGSPGVIGQSLRIGKRTVTVIGIAPSRFTGLELRGPDLWLPLGSVSWDEGWRAWPNDRGATWLRVVVRLQPDVSRAAADREANAANQRGFEASGLNPDGEVMRLGPVLRAQDGSRSRVVQVSFWLTGMAVALLLVAAVNVSGLLLVRARQREHEFAVRQALGASRGQLTRQLLVEGALIGVFAGVAALWAARGIGAVLRVILVPGYPLPVHLDFRILGFTALLAMGGSLACAVWPVLGLRRQSLAAAFQSRTETERVSRIRVRQWLVGGQVALTLMLLIAASLFLRSLRKAAEISFGLDADRLLVMWLPRDSSNARPDALLMDIRESLRSLPEVEQVTLSVNAPFRSSWYKRLIPEGRAGVVQPPFGSDLFNEQINWVTSDYFAATGIRILRGRQFFEDDRVGSPPVVIVNETLARMIAPGTDALGRRLHIGSSEAPLTEIVGIAADSKTGQVLGPYEAQFYVPFDQPTVGEKPDSRFLLLRTRESAAAAAETIRRTMADCYPGISLVQTRPLGQEIEPQLAPWKLGSRALGIFSSLALLIASVGIYGVVDQAVARRTREIGIRLALGGARSQVQRRMAGHGLKPALAGTVAGLLGSLALVRLLQGLLFGIEPVDPVTFVTVPSALLALIALACWLPARRASRVDPVVALRSE